MDFQFTPEEEAFRQEVRDFVKAEMPPGYSATGEGSYDPHTHELAKTMAKKLGERRWLAMNWPEQYGGMGASPIMHMIYKEEMAYHGVPGTDMGMGGISWVGPTVLILGTDEQKREHLPPLAAGDRFWCTMYSEPEAGSDMAALKCRAVRRGDEYVVNGQKVWTSAAHIADWAWLLARTDPDAPKHKGISLILVDMKSPGITVRPLVNMAGHHYFNEVFFDDVHVPAANLIGEENRGWYHSMVALSFERTAGVSMAAAARRGLEELIEFAKTTVVNGEPLAKNMSIRHQLAQLVTEVEAARVLGYRIVWLQCKGELPGVEGPIVKVLGSEILQSLGKVGTEMMGLYAQLMPGCKRAPLQGRVSEMWLGANDMIIAAGTNEIQRNIIAQRGLGMPRV
ncbi:MAG: acyl-CoA dehydrogenase family protein [Chloroflexota bacterium]|nr:acyl-CoA dehydrogenase family protein [Chloroflexota bacterium]